ncbi:MAG: nuclear transport factor 2 family protein [Blastocatellia bacterium]|nr:nuclear transport factor 2 family protein [Blastocatellia bacterium]
MKGIVALLILIPTLAFAAFPSQRITVPPQSDDAEMIRRLMQEISDAFVARRSEPFERIYDENHFGVRSRPVFNSREQLFAIMNHDSAVLKAGKKLDFETLSYTFEEPDIRLFGDTAIVHVLKHDRWRYRGSNCHTRYQATDLWIRREGVWKLAGGHLTTMQCSPMPWLRPHPALASLRDRRVPYVRARPATETAIQAIVNALAKPDPVIRTYFDPSFVMTDAEGSASPGPQSLIRTFVTAANPAQDHILDSEIVVEWGETAVYMFRVRPRVSESTQIDQHMVILIKMDGRYQIVAAHVSKLED